MRVRPGIAFDGFISTPDAIAMAKRAVAAGADSLWVAGHIGSCAAPGTATGCGAAGADSLWVAEHLGYREAAVTCMAFALAAPGATVVPTAVSPYLWHPTPTAMTMATLAEVAPGRAAIAVGI